MIIALSGHEQGQQVSHLQLAAGLGHFGLNIKRTTEILDDLGLLDDRITVSESWLA
ncbi:hypothetical protein ACU686_42185 [Yinghuangia aomiensis]